MKKIGVIILLACICFFFVFFYYINTHKPAPGHLYFTNIQKESGITFKNRLSPSLNHTPSHYGHGSGVTAADIDNDGLIDVYFLKQYGSNALYKNLGHGRFKDITKTSHTGTDGKTSIGAAFADYDNDGDEDLFVTTIRKGTILFENDGSGYFTDVTNKAGVQYNGHPSTAIWFDYNNDGYLDLLLINVGPFTNSSETVAKQLGYYEAIPDSFFQQFQVPGEPPVLWRNNGNKTFTDVSKQANLLFTDWVGAAAITDSNKDNYPDIYVTSMAGGDHFFLNKHGETFEEVTNNYFPKTPWGSMGAKFFDYNNDGKFDLYVTDMHSDMMSDIVETYPNKKIHQKDVNQYLAKTQFGGTEYLNENIFIYGNAFYQQNNNNSFKEVSDKLGLETLWPWGISVADFDADGYEDIFLPSGMGGRFKYQENILLYNKQGKGFEHRENTYGIEPRKEGTSYDILLKNGTIMRMVRSSRSSVLFDMDNDGDIDIITNEANDYPLILENNLSNVQHISYISIVLKGVTSNKNGLGSTIVIEDSSGSKQYRYLDGNSGYFGFSPLPLYIGIPSGRTIKNIQIIWPSGIVQNTGKIQINQQVTLTEYKK